MRKPILHFFILINHFNIKRGKEQYLKCAGIYQIILKDCHILRKYVLNFLRLLKLMMSGTLFRKSVKNGGNSGQRIKVQFITSELYWLHVNKGISKALFFHFFFLLP